MRKILFLTFAFLCLETQAQVELKKKEEILTLPKVNAPKVTAPKTPALPFKLPEINPNFVKPLNEKNIDFTGANGKKYLQREFQMPQNVTGLESPQTDDDVAFKLGDMDFGEFSVKENSIVIYCRDHGAIDGDLIDILVNDQVVLSNVYLEAAFKGYPLQLKPGFNKIEIKALNEGYSRPNTAQFRVVNEKGDILVSEQWGLSAGSKAKFMIIKN